MRKRLVGVRLMAAATVLAFHPMEQLDEEYQTNIGTQQDGDQNSGSPVEEASGMPTNQTPITLIETIEMDITLSTSEPT
ncbi:hypothetical protein J7E79_15475 [Bacillus sp. ISL-40]|uniref:hypothetical protein n=1 Tax=unclassified Bacillus (in: firmicutes) TaxID=185979 RepID=UPI001BE8271E|nr:MULTISPECIES: hypothetical protein [unclassified Bacillus (in: firmicutes)]MBT2698803.1 hypothetical protein [Bacillus sp. ISL-40]MBT2720754.1 hypothetical protein [Bacillus sp. ISL-46]MBT2740969.1 hypothetical protein [Bacillus sp. ISL-77]